MSEKNLKLKELKIQSFVTTLTDAEKKALVGGHCEVPDGIVTGGPIVMGSTRQGGGGGGTGTVTPSGSGPSDFGTC